MKKLIFTVSFLFALSSVNAQSSFMAPTYVPEYNPYIPTVDVNLYSKVIRQKQDLYDRNLERINERINDCNEYLLDLKEVDEPNYHAYQKSIKEWMDKTFSRRQDLSNTETYNYIKGSLDWYVTMIRKAIRNAQ